MIVTDVVAISENHVIGKDNQLLWYLPNDLKHFKDITTGHTVIMGRKTFDSVGKPLPKRRNIIITRQAITIAGCEVVNSVEAALALCAGEEEVFIVGGCRNLQTGHAFNQSNLPDHRTQTFRRRQLLP